MILFPKEVYALIQIEAELSRGGWTDDYDVRANVWIFETDHAKAAGGPEIVDLAAIKDNIAQLYLIRPFLLPAHETDKHVQEQLQQVLYRWRLKFETHGIAGCCSFVYFSPYIMDESQILVYWCAGNGIIYYQMLPKAEFLCKTKLFVLRLNFLYIQYLKSRKYT